MSGPTASASRSGTPSSTSCATRSGNSTSRTCCTPTAGRRPATSHPQATRGGLPGSAPSSLTRRGLMKTTDTCAAPEGQAIPVTGTSWKDTALVALDLEGSGAQARQGPQAQSRTNPSGQGVEKSRVLSREAQCASGYVLGEVLGLPVPGIARTPGGLMQGPCQPDLAGCRHPRVLQARPETIR